MGNVLTYCPVAPSGAQSEPALLVGEAHCGAVDLDLGGVARRLHLRYESSVPRLPLGQLLGAEGVGQREHGALVGVLGEYRRGDRTHPLRGAVWRLELRVCRLEGLELPEQPVVLSVRDLRRVEDVIRMVGAADLLAQAGRLLCRRHGWDNNATDSGCSACSPPVCSGCTNEALTRRWRPGWLAVCGGGCDW